MCQRHFVLASVFVLSFKLPVVGEVESKGASTTREGIFKAVQSLSRERDLFAAPYAERSLCGWDRGVNQTKVE